MSICEKMLMCNVCKQLTPTEGKYKCGGGHQHYADGEDDHFPA